VKLKTIKPQLVFIKDESFRNSFIYSLRSDTLKTR